MYCIQETVYNVLCTFSYIQWTVYTIHKNSEAYSSPYTSYTVHTYLSLELYCKQCMFCILLTLFKWLFMYEAYCMLCNCLLNIIYSIYYVLYSLQHTTIQLLYSSVPNAAALWCRFNNSPDRRPGTIVPYTEKFIKIFFFKKQIILLTRILHKDVH